jgi:hypothetical protein
MTLEIIYHVLAIIFALLWFFMKVTARNDVLEFFLKSLSKLGPLFVIGYAMVQIFKLVGII